MKRILMTVAGVCMFVLSGCMAGPILVLRPDGGKIRTDKMRE